MYFVLVAADIFGVKTNFELAFPQRPTVLELSRATETAFTAEIAVRRPDGVPPHSFHISKFKLYDEDRGRWVDLQSDAQLQDLCQCYAFQHENPWHRESQKEIPPAVRPPAPTSTSYGSSGPLRPASAFNNTFPSTAAGAAGAANVGSSAMNSSRGLPPQSARSIHNQMNRGVSADPYTGSRLTGAVPDVNAPVEEKIRVVFAEFALKDQRAIDVEDMKKGFRTLGFDFTTATVNDLFQKGDANHDGRISFHEFERFARLYPIMTDCLYYRSKTFWEDQNTQREIDAEKEAVKQANFQVAQVENQVAAARKAAEQAQGAIADAENDMRQHQNRSRDIVGQNENIIRDKEKFAKEKFEREADANAIRERERQARSTLADAQRENDKLDRRNTGAAQDLQKAEDRVKLLQQQLLEAQKQLERAQNNQRQTQGDLENARGRERDAQRDLDNIQAEAPRVEEDLRKAQQNFENINDRVRDMELAQRDAQRDADEAANRRNNAERAAESAREYEQRMQDELDNARRVAQQREDAAKQRETELLEQQRLRQQVSAQERALIEQELRLREQRESLEEKEGRLKNEASSFLASVRSNLSNRGASSDPSSSSYRRGDSVSYRP